MDGSHRFLKRKKDGSHDYLHFGLGLFDSVPIP